jgi:hypothetical protein
LIMDMGVLYIWLSRTFIFLEVVDMILKVKVQVLMEMRYLLKLMLRFQVLMVKLKLIF